MEKPKSKKAAAASQPKRSAANRRRRTLYTPQEIDEIFRRFSVQRAEPKGELEHVNAFTLLVAVVLSAQATDAGVNRATRALFAVADTPEKMLALGEEAVGVYIRTIGLWRNKARNVIALSQALIRDFGGEEAVGQHIRTIGLWRNKARNVIALSQALIRDFGGEVPQTREELVTLPGVGRKTANVVLNMSFGQPTMAVDTHILRIGNRIGLAPGKTPEQVEGTLVRIIPDKYMRHAHHWLILHGRYVCKARKPDCPACVIADICKSPEKTTSTPAPLVPIGDPEPLAAQ